MENSPGVYKIICLTNSKVYIGSSQTIRQRIINHKSSLRLNKHANIHLQRAFNKYGEVNFSFELIEYCTTTVLLDREQYYIDLYDSYNKGFNRMPLASSPRGRVYSEEERKRRNLTRKPAWNKGRARTEEEKVSHSLKMTGRKAWNKGVQKSEEQKVAQRLKAKTKKPVLAFDKSTEVIVKEFESLGDISRTIDVRRDVLSYLCLSFKKKQRFADSIKYNVPFYLAYKQDYNINK